MVWLDDAEGQDMKFQLNRAELHLPADYEGQVITITGGMKTDHWNNNRGGTTYAVEVTPPAAITLGGPAPLAQPVAPTATPYVAQPATPLTTPAQPVISLREITGQNPPVQNQILDQSEEFMKARTHLLTCWDATAIWEETPDIHQKMAVTLFIETKRLAGKLDERKLAQLISASDNADVPPVTEMGQVPAQPLEVVPEAPAPAAAPSAATEQEDHIPGIPIPQKEESGADDMDEQVAMGVYVGMKTRLTALRFSAEQVDRAFISMRGQMQPSDDITTVRGILRHGEEDFIKLIEQVDNEHLATVG